MSQLVVQPKTTVDAIPLGRRISEIMKEKGKYYTVTAMAARIGIHRETYRMMLKGERDIYTFELEKIAEDLKLPVGRITQEDIFETVNVLEGNLYSATNLKKSLELASEVAQFALGLTERCKALHRLGHVYFLLQEYELSQKSLHTAHTFAQKIVEEYGENDLLYSITFNLVDTCTARHEYVTATHLLEEVSLTFANSPSRCAALFYLQARISESQGDLQTALSLVYASLEQAFLSQSENIIARAKINVAHFEYLSQNYSVSMQFLQEASLLLSKEDKTYFIAQKELVKSLIKLGDFDNAEKTILSTLVDVKSIDFPDMEGKLLLLHSRTKNDPLHAECVTSDQLFSKKVRFLACKFLIAYYRKTGDAKKLIHYHEIAEELNGTLSDILDEGDL
jgi:transcriptional regulator with XRE-family HTH domain